MTPHHLYATLRRWLPRPLAHGVRALGTVLLTPIQFSVRSGHLASALRGRAVDREGKPIPWYTYPAIDFLRARSVAGRRVLEFGAGQSTLWWAERAEQVVALESDGEWLRQLQQSPRSNVELHHLPVDLTGVGDILGERHFDVIVIDGLVRHLAAAEADRRLAPDGAILFDNSDDYTRADGSNPILDPFRSRGYARVDFYGHAPGLLLPHCTSLLFKGSCFLLRDAANPKHRAQPSNRSAMHVENNGSL